MNLSEIKNLVNFIIDNNRALRSEGKKPTAMCLEGDAGIGKTSILEEIAQERNATYIKIVLSQLEEVGD